MVDGKVIFITGGTGSFGKQFIKTVLEDYKPKRVIVYSRDELKQFEMSSSHLFSAHSSLMQYLIGDVRDYNRLVTAMTGVDIVIHTAALKQVPTTEYNPFEAVKTNIIGGQNVIDAAVYNEVEKVIALSTDKAAAPINLYGATKLTSDKLFVAANNYRNNSTAKFSVVRYGNVIWSRGSVVPFFVKEKETGVLPITDERMTRFNITLQHGVNFVLQCLERMWSGELFIPKIPSYRILDLAEAIAPECEHKIIGVRPGEKLHEEMITAMDSMNTIEFDDYFVVLPSIKLWDIDKFRKTSNSSAGKFCEYGFSYNSGTNEKFLTVEELKNVIKENAII